MSSLVPNSLYPDRGLRAIVYSAGLLLQNPCFRKFQSLYVGSFPAKDSRVRGGGLTDLRKKRSYLPCIKCKNKDESYEDVSVELPPYDVYFDSTSGQLEPASGARAAIPGKEYWPEGTASRVKAAAAPEPTGKSHGSSSHGKKPGSRRKKNKASVAASEISEVSAGVKDALVISDSDDAIEKQAGGLDDALEERKNLSSEFVIYEEKPEEVETTEYELNKELGLPHPFIDPAKKRPIENPLTSQELWWNWRQPDKQQWSRWQRRRPDVETVFLKAMAKTGQIKLYGEQPTLTETSLYRARRHLFKQERVQAEQERLIEVGPIAYYSEWVKAWNRDTSREAIQKHFEETGEDENKQLIQMFSVQTDREYRIMMGTDVRIPRDPLAMRMPEEEIKQIWGGDPVYPTVNYIQDPDAVIDYRGPEFHEPTPNLLEYLKEHGKIVPREEFEKIQAKENTEEFEQVADMDDAMARAVDIGEDDGEESEVEAEEVEEEKITRNWSVLKSTPQLRKPKDKPKKDGPLTLADAIDDSENLTDFLMDFDDDE